MQHFRIYYSLLQYNNPSSHEYISLNVLCYLLGGYRFFHNLPVKHHKNLGSLLMCVKIHLLGCILHHLLLFRHQNNLCPLLMCETSTSRVHSLSSIIPSPPKQSISTSNVHKRSTFSVHSLPSIIPAPPTLLCVKPILLEFVLHHLLLLHQHRNAYY